MCYFLTTLPLIFYFIFFVFCDYYFKCQKKLRNKKKQKEIKREKINFSLTTKKRCTA